MKLAFFLLLVCVVSIINGEDEGLGGAGASKGAISPQLQSRFERILDLDKTLGKAVYSGNDSDISIITKELTTSVQKLMPQVSPRLQKFLTFCIFEIGNIPQLMQTGNRSGVIAIMALIRITFTQLSGGDTDGFKIPNGQP